MFKKALKFIALVVLISLVVFIISELSSNTPVAILKKLIREGKLNSQSISLKLDYLLFIPVGQARLDNLGKEKFRKEDFIHLQAEAKTFDYVASIFHAKARVDSYIYPKDLLSGYFLQHLEMINKPDDNREIRYNQKNHIMTYQGLRGKEDRAIDAGTQDPLSAIFYMQNKKFSLGEEFKISLNTNQKNYIIAGKFLSKEVFLVNNKNYDILLAEVQVSRKDKSPRHQFRFKIWFLDEGNIRRPILIKATTNIGPIIARAQ